MNNFSILVAKNGDVESFSDVDGNMDVDLEKTTVSENSLPKIPDHFKQF